jgi:hypothetical protein
MTFDANYRSWLISRNRLGAIVMTDLWMVLLSLLFFAVAIGYTLACERLR